MSEPTVSVIIPTYNRALQLKTAIESVLLQTYHDLELIIVDDGSTDQTGPVVQLLTQNTRVGGERIRYFYQQNRGQSIATNEGLQKVNGKWVAFLDSDDIWLPTKLETQLGALQQFGPACKACFTDAKYVNNPLLTTTAFGRARMRFDERVGVVRNSTSFLLVEPHGIYVQSLIVQASLLNEMEAFDPALRVFLDKDFIFRLSNLTDFCFINLPLLEIDRNTDRPEGLIELFANEEFRLTQLQYLYEKWLKLDWPKRSHRLNIRAKLGEIHSGWASWYLFKEDYQKAIAASAAAVRSVRSSRSLLKYLLILLSPSAARRIVVKRECERSRLQATT
jgi:glycosyltransferase involved in cell wall biosynthesis